MRKTTLLEKSLYSELFWSVFSRIWSRITANMDTFYPVLVLTITSESQEQDKQINSDPVNSVFDTLTSLLSDVRRDLPGYAAKVIQDKLSGNRQYDNPDSISFLALIDN